MAISIDENILLGVAGLVFIPVLVFFVKLIIEVGTIKSKIDGLNNQISKSETGFSKIEEHSSDLRVLKLRMDNLEKDVDHLSKSANPESSYGKERRMTRQSQRDLREIAEGEDDNKNG